MTPGCDFSEALVFSLQMQGTSGMATLHKATACLRPAQGVLYSPHPIPSPPFCVFPVPWEAELCRLHNQTPSRSVFILGMTSGRQWRFWSVRGKHRSGHFFSMSCWSCALAAVRSGCHCLQAALPCLQLYLGFCGNAKPSLQLSIPPSSSLVFLYLLISRCFTILFVP